MPLVVPVIPLPASASPTLLASGRTLDAGAAGSREFSEVFREQASGVRDCVSRIAAAPHESGKTLGPELPASKVESSNNASPRLIEPAEPESDDAASANSSPKQSQTQSQNPLPASVVGNRAAPPNSSAPVLLTESASPSSIQLKGPESPSSAQAVPAQHKTKQESPKDKQSGAVNINSPIPDVGPNLAPCNPPAVALSAPPSTAKPVPLSSIQQQPASIAGKSPRASAPSATLSASGADSQVQPAAVEGHAATPPTLSSGEPASANEDTPHSTPLSSSGSTNITATSLPDGSASPKASSESLSSTPLNSLAPHASHPAEQGTGGAVPSVPSSATSADPHSTEAGTASPAAPHLPQLEAATAISPAAAPAANAAPNLYDKIDQGITPLVLHSGPQHVAVGIRDPSLGWVEIKTQSMAGRVDATLVTSSLQTHASLASQLPAMAQYLEQRDVRVGTLAVHHEMPNAGAGSSQNTGTGNGSGQAGAGNSGTGPDSNHRGSGSQGTVDRYTGVSPGIERSFAVPAAAEENIALRSVSYISVRA